MVCEERKVMNALLKKTSISILLIAGATSVFAAPGHGRAFSGAGEPHFRNQVADRSGFQSERRMNSDSSRRSNGPGSQDGNRAQENQFDNAAEQGRKPGRMSPEERRALRRQINEAGHDIYLSKP